jgi:hypothetical protein
VRPKKVAALGSTERQTRHVACHQETGRSDEIGCFKKGQRQIIGRVCFSEKNAIVIGKNAIAACHSDWSVLGNVY